ncbi:hypothetical protein BRDID11002_11030 [Bradyrhizobium diazoefficiens]
MSGYSAARLRDVIKTHEGNLLSFLGNNDVYDPDRIEADRDLIRRFYLKNGFADAQVVAALTEYDPGRKGFLVTFKIEEGQQYRVGSVDFRSTVPGFDPAALRSYSRVNAGSLYNVELVEKSVEDMQIEASRRGFAFAVVRPDRRPQLRGPNSVRCLLHRRRAAHPTSSGSTFAATPARATMSSAANSTSPRAMPTTARWSTVLNGG